MVYPIFSSPIGTLSQDLQKQITYIGNSIMSIFEKNSTGSRKNGCIDEREFNSVTKLEYEAKIKQYKATYKKQYGKDIEFHIPTYNELSEMLKYKYTGEREFQVGNKISYNEIFEAVIPNGDISQTNQQGSGECYQDSADIALSYKEKGREALKRSISLTSDGYKVTLFGAKPKKEIYISRTELKKAQEEILPNSELKYSSGDADMVLLDLAIEKYRKISGHELLYKNTASQKGYDDYLSSGFSSEVFKLITGISTGSATYKKRKGISQLSENSVNTTQTSKIITYNRDCYNRSITERLRNLADHGNNVAVTFTAICFDNKWDKFHNYGLNEEHAHAIKKIDAKAQKIYYINPHSGKNTIYEMSFKEFEKYCATMDWLILF